MRWSWRLLPENQGHNLTLTVLYVPALLYSELAKEELSRMAVVLQVASSRLKCPRHSPTVGS
jgi:hypothetical protein